MKTILFSFATLLALAARAGMVDFTTPPGSSGNDGPLSAEAVITSIDGGGVSITLNDLLQNPTSAGQLVSGVTFNITDAFGGASVASSIGALATISAGGSYTPGAATLLLHWAVTMSGSTVTLTALSGGQPNEMIIGADDAGSTSGQGKYSAANSSIMNFNPSVLGSASFTLSIPGVSGSSVISDVSIEFGTGPDTIIPPPSVPDGGTTASLLGLTILGIALSGRSLGTSQLARC